MLHMDRTHSAMLINGLPGAIKGLGSVSFALFSFTQTQARVLEKGDCDSQRCVCTGRTEP